MVCATREFLSDAPPRPEQPSPVVTPVAAVRLIRSAETCGMLSAPGRIRIHEPRLGVVVNRSASGGLDWERRRLAGTSAGRSPAWVGPCPPALE